MIKQKKNQKRFVILVAVIILLIFFYMIGALIFIENPIRSALSTTQNTLYNSGIKIKNSFINYSEAQDIKKKNQELSEQISALLSENAELQQYRIENQTLKDLLSFTETTPHTYEIAKVISRQPDRVNTIVINRGDQHKIQNGYPVITDNGILIGKIIEVKKASSTVLLLTDTQQKIAVSMPDQEGTIGIAQGEFGLSIKIELIPQNIEITQDDIIISSGLEKHIPRSLIVGRVNRVIQHENELFKTATISPVIDYDEVSIVSVIIPSQMYD